MKIAIVGGGCASIAAAFELTRPEHAGRHEVTIYQQGWRLGGKGASGRGPNGRIEEHGLHVWLGFYENAFRLMRECYAEAARDPRHCPISDWRDAFFDDPFVGMADRDDGGDWLHWTAFFPPAPGLPGDPLTDTNPFTMRGYVMRTLGLLRTLLLGVQTHQSAAGRTSNAHPPTSGQAHFDAPPGAGDGPTTDKLADTINQVTRVGVVGTMTGLIEACTLLETAIKALPQATDSTVGKLVHDNLLIGPVVTLLQQIARAAGGALRRMVRKNDDIRYIWEIIDLVIAILVGIVRDGLMFDPRGFDAINDRECRQWLLDHGASPESVDSAFVRGLFDLAMAYQDGDQARPALAAGQAIRGSLRMFFTYRGAMFWKMRAGMGDVVFAPFYEVLKARGVKFRFFHRLENVCLGEAADAGDKPYVSALEFDVQARTISGEEYAPLVPVRGLPCWPAKPDYRQLVDGERLAAEERDFESFWDRRRTSTLRLDVGRDFDFVVLGVGVGAIEHVCPQIVARDPRWRDMVREVKTVPTQAFQVWLKEDMNALGWRDASPTLSAFAKPFDTWSDMGHLIDMEDWPQPPRAIAYFCGVLRDSAGPVDRDDADYPLHRAAEVRANAIAHLDQQIGHLWPRAVTDGGFRWELLLDSGETGNTDHPIDTQFWTANVNPSDRYTLAPPGSMQYRISPLDNTYDNLTIAGDWTDCGFNEGCVEAAVMSGRLAAHALCAAPALEQIIGYDHP